MTTHEILGEHLTVSAYLSGVALLTALCAILFYGGADVYETNNAVIFTISCMSLVIAIYRLRSESADLRTFYGIEVLADEILEIFKAIRMLEKIIFLSALTLICSIVSMVLIGRVIGAIALIPAWVSYCALNAFIIHQYCSLRKILGIERKVYAKNSIWRHLRDKGPQTYRALYSFIYSEMEKYDDLSQTFWFGYSENSLLEDCIKELLQSGEIEETWCRDEYNWKYWLKEEEDEELLPQNQA
jgi:hypothetical protein